MKLEKKILGDGDVVKFEPRTARYGSAEFIICVTLQRGVPKCFHVEPAQQPAATHCYEIPLLYRPTSWSISAWTHKGIDEPRIWVHWWCKEHKGPAMRVYAPRQSHQFTVSMLSTFGIYFDL